MTGTGLSAADRAVRLVIYLAFADRGRPPSVAEMAAETGLAETGVKDALRNLHDARAIVLTPAGDAVRMAHPFSAAPMGFVVGADGRGPAGYSGDRMWWGGCAWDSFGIGAALGEPVVIRTRCPGWARAGSHPVGQVIPSVTMWQLAQTWYGDRLDPDWSPRPAAAAQRLLEQCGLSDGFWRLAS